MSTEGGWGIGAAVLGFISLFLLSPGFAIFLNIASGLIIYGIISDLGDSANENTMGALYLGFAMNIISGIYNAFLL